jgi:acetyltransferase
VKALDPFFIPRGCAVVGASRDPAKPGHQVLRNLRAIGHPGPVYPVNPRERELEGWASYPDLTAIPGPLDLVVLCVPATTIPSVLDAVRCRRRDRQDLRAIITTAGGYAETGTPEGRARQAELEAFCRQEQILHLGPNCIGVIDTHNRMDTTFLLGTAHQPGGISFLSQSGAFGAWILQSWSSRPRPTGFNRFISLGNMVGVDLVQAMTYLGQDERTRVIGMYLEGYPDARGLLMTAAQVAQTKPVVILKVGVTAAGRQAACSHTGALAGEDALYDGAFRQYGLIRAKTVEELLDTLQAFDTLPSPAGSRVFLMTHAGGPGVYATDALAALPEIEPARVTDATRQSLVSVLPPFAAVCRPEGHLDMTASGTATQHAMALELLLGDPGVDAVFLLDLPTLFLSAEELADHLIEAYHRASTGPAPLKPFLPCLMAGKWVAEGRRRLEEAGIPTFETPDRAARAFANLVRYHKLRKDGRQALSLPLPAAGGAAGRGQTLTEPEVYRMMAVEAIPIAAWRMAGNPAAAAAAATELGFPVALKLVSPDLPHKSEAGAVVLNLAHPAAIIEAWERAVATARAHRPDLRIIGGLVQRMARGQEFIVGGLRDPQFGPVVMVGAGGVLAEHMRDVAWRLAPVDEGMAMAMIGELQASSLLDGVRGGRPADRRALAQLVAAVSRWLAADGDLMELDLNPVMVGATGTGCQVVDALAVRLSPVTDP